MSIGQASARKCMKKALNNGAEFVALSLTIDVSNRERFMKNPALYMAAETKNAEVSYGKLRSEERPLFDEAMTRELAEFLKSEACRRCDSAEELAEARASGRCIPARWLLQWRPIAPDDRAAAKVKRKEEKPFSTINPSLAKKAEGAS